MQIKKKDLYLTVSGVFSKTNNKFLWVFFFLFNLPCDFHQMICNGGYKEAVFVKNILVFNNIFNSPYNLLHNEFFMFFKTLIPFGSFFCPMSDMYLLGVNK